MVDDGVLNLIEGVTIRAIEDYKQAIKAPHISVNQKTLFDIEWYFTSPQSLLNYITPTGSDLWESIQKEYSI